MSAISEQVEREIQTVKDELERQKNALAGEVQDRINEVTSYLNGVTSELNSHNAKFKTLEIAELKKWAVEKSKLEEILKAYQQKYKQVCQERDEKQKALLELRVFLGDMQERQKLARTYHRI